MDIKRYWGSLSLESLFGVKLIWRTVEIRDGEILSLSDIVLVFGFSYV